MKRILLCTMMPLIVFCSTQNLAGTSAVGVQQKDSVSFESTEFFLTDSNDDSVLPIDPVALNISVQSNNNQKETVNASSTVVNKPAATPNKTPSSEKPSKVETSDKKDSTTSTNKENTKVEAPSNIKYYDVPLTNEQQAYAMKVCEKYGVDVKLIFAMMSVESTYNPNSVNGNCYGILQINKIHLNNFKKILGVTEIKSYESNVLCGVYMISGYLKKYDNVHKALICYNCGSGNASKLFAKEIFSTSYSRKVVSRMEKIKLK